MSTELVRALDTPRAYINDYAEPKNGATPIRIVHLTAKASNEQFDRAAADYAQRTGVVTRA